MFAINVAHLETQGIFWTSKIGAESLFLFFFMCAINVAHLETQAIFWTSKIGVESLFFSFFYVCHQRGAFGNPGNFLDFTNRRGIPIFNFFLYVPSTWRIWKPREFFGLQK